MSDLLEQEDFCVPQKQSAAGILMMFIDSFQKIIRSLIIPLIYFLIKSDYKMVYLLWFFAAVTLVVGIIAYVKYHRFTFFLDQKHQEFVINKGLFTKTNLTIQLNKIQQVNINQSFIQRLLNVYSLEIDTAGSEKKEASIKAVSKEVAEKLKHALLEGNHLETTPIEGILPLATSQSLPFLKLSSSTLLKIGITSNYGQTTALIIGFLAATYEGLMNLNEFFFKLDEEEVGNRLQDGATLLSMGLLIGFTLILVLTINVIRVFLKYYNFQIVRQKHSLAITSGLFSTKNTLLNPQKVQLSGYSQNYFQKKLNMLNMRMKQDSGAESASGEEVKKSDIEIPGCSSIEKDAILQMIFNELPEKGAELRPNYRYLYSGILSWMVLPVLLLLSAGYLFLPQLQPYYPFILPWVIGSGALIYFGYRNHRIYVSEGYITKKSGIWDIQYQIVEPHKIQAIGTAQRLWHKKSDIGHMTLYTAAGTISFRFGNFTKINQLVNYWLYQIETSKKDWM